MSADILPILACGPVDPAIYLRLKMPVYRPAAGFTVTTCDKCKQQVWIGPLQRAKRQAEGRAVLCWVCAAPDFRDAEVRNLESEATSPPK